MFIKVNALDLIASDQKSRLRVVYQQLYAHFKTAGKLASGAVKEGKNLKRECDTGRLTEQRYKEAVIRLERLMTELSKLPAYQAFILPITTHIVQSLTLSVQERWKRELTSMPKENNWHGNTSSSSIPLR